eukprot:365176-Chlamydomonas_euryale.AAC.10
MHALLAAPVYAAGGVGLQTACIQRSKSMCKERGGLHTPMGRQRDGQATRWAGNTDGHATGRYRAPYRSSRRVDATLIDRDRVAV